MEMLQRADIEEHLESWAKASLVIVADPAVVLKDANLYTSVLDRIDWTRFRKRGRDPVAFDALVVTSRGYGAKLAEAATANDAAAIATLSEQLITSCTDCHKQFR